MRRDPTIEEVRRIKQAQAARYSYDIRATCKDLRKEQRRSGAEAVSHARKREPAKT